MGSGIAGLTAAWRLAELGVTSQRLFELEPNPGGTSAFGTDGVVPYPWAAHYLPQPKRANRALTQLLGEMGVLEPGPPDADPEAKEECLVREPEERVFVRDAWHEGLYPHALATPADLELFFVARLSVLLSSPCRSKTSCGFSSKTTWRSPAEVPRYPACPRPRSVM